MTNNDYRQQHERFVTYICQKCQDRRIAAHLRRADAEDSNLTTLQVLLAFGIDISKKWQFLPFSMITAAIARGKCQKNGSISLASALRLCSKHSGDEEAMDRRLMQLLSCDDLERMSRCLRSTLSYVNSRMENHIDYAALLGDLIQFSTPEGRERVKRQWAKDFYSAPIPENSNASVSNQGDEEQDL